MAERVELTPVGKGKPPTSSRFKKGKSGNPSGRPKGRKNLRTIVRTVAQEMQQVDLDGEPRELPTSALLIVMLQRRALRGDYGVKRLLDEVREKYGAPDTDSGLPAIVTPRRLDMETWSFYAAAQRKRMLWAQEQQLKDDAAAKQTAASSDTLRQPLKSPDETARCASAGPVQRSCERCWPSGRLARHVGSRRHR